MRIYGRKLIIIIIFILAAIGWMGWLECKVDAENVKCKMQKQDIEIETTAVGFEPEPVIENDIPEIELKQKSIHGFQFRNLRPRLLSLKQRHILIIK